MSLPLLLSCVAFAVSVWCTHGIDAHYQAPMFSQSLSHVFEICDLFVILKLILSWKTISPHILVLPAKLIRDTAGDSALWSCNYDLSGWGQSNQLSDISPWKMCVSRMRDHLGDTLHIPASSKFDVKQLFWAHIPLRRTIVCSILARFLSNLVLNT